MVYVCQDGFTRHGFLTETYGWAHALWKINVESATKANQSKAVTGAQFGAFFDKTDNASSNEPRNLCNTDSETVISGNRDGIALIMLRRLIERSV